MNRVRISSLAFLLVLCTAAAADDRLTDTAIIELHDCEGLFNNGLRLVLNGEESGSSAAVPIPNDSRWLWTQKAARFTTTGSVASLRAGTWRSHCRRSEYDHFKDQDVAKFTFYCDSYSDQQIEITNSSDTRMTVLRKLPSGQEDDKLDSPCTEFYASNGTLKLGVRLPSETVLLRFRNWKGDDDGPGLRIFEKADERRAGLSALDRSVRHASTCRGKHNAVCLTKDAVIRVLGEQRKLNAQAAPNDYDIDQVLNQQLKEVTFTVK